MLAPRSRNASVLIVASLAVLALPIGAFIRVPPGATIGAPLRPLAAPTVMAATAFPVVHHAGAALLALDAFPGLIPQFAERYVGDRRTGEPTLGFDSTGAAYYGGFWGRGDSSTIAATDAPRGALDKSADGGLTWSDVTPQLAAGDWPRDTSDPLTYSDPSTGRVFDLQYSQTACPTIGWSDDGGASWGTSLLACAAPVVNDHPGLGSGRATVLPTVGYPDVLYLCSNTKVLTSCAHSLDGGLTWTPGQPMNGPCDDSTNDLVGTVTEAATGYGWGLTSPPVASQASDGTVYVGTGVCGVTSVEVSHDNGLSWTRVVVDRAHGREPHTASWASWHDAAIAVDAAGNAYVLWIAADHLPYLSRSSDFGAHWSDAMMVGAPGVTAAKFPSIAAGAPGHVVAFYLGSTVPGGFDASTADMANATWDGFVTTTLDALDPAPVFATALAHDANDPLQRGPCDGRCQIATRNSMFDFMDVKIDPVTGATWIALTDQCNARCVAEGVPSAVEVSNRAAVSVQVGGTLLASPRTQP